MISTDNIDFNASHGPDPSEGSHGTGQRVRGYSVEPLGSAIKVYVARWGGVRTWPKKRGRVCGCW